MLKNTHNGYGKMKRLLKRMLDETEFLSDYGIRSLSKHYQDNPYYLKIDGEELFLKYQLGVCRS